MKFTKSIAAAVSALALGAAAQEFSISLNATRSGLNINNLGETALVSYANSTIWIGGIKSEIYSEPFLIQGSQGGLVFTSWHNVPTGWQNAYLYPNETLPIGFTVPHGASVPTGASTSGFVFDTEGFLTYNGVNNFYGCQSVEESTLATYEIYWFGNGEPNGVSCVGPLYLQRDAGVVTIG